MPHFVKDEEVFEAVQSLRSDVDKLLKNAGLDEKPQEKQAPEGEEGEAKAAADQPPAEAKGSGSKAQQSGSSGSSPQSTKDAEKK